MSHFYGSVQGGRGEATRCGHKATGIESWVQNNHCRIRIVGKHDEETGIDEFEIYVDSGRQVSVRTQHPLRVMQDDDQLTIIHDIKSPGTINGNVTVKHNVCSSQAKFKFDKEC